MAKKKIFLDDKKRKELEGFEEALDLIGESGTEIRNQNKETQIEDYEIYDFLEKEIVRLEKLDQFFTTQIPLDRKYSQSQKLLEKERDATAMIKEELIEKLLRSDSGLSSFLEEIYKRSLSK